MVGFEKGSERLRKMMKIFKYASSGQQALRGPRTTMRGAVLGQ